MRVATFIFSALALFLSAAALGLALIHAGPAGPQGATGPAGRRGPAGASGTTALQQREIDYLADQVADLNNCVGSQVPDEYGRSVDPALTCGPVLNR